jgi:hypothetical protein
MSWLSYRMLAAREGWPGVRNKILLAVSNGVYWPSFSDMSSVRRRPAGERAAVQIGYICWRSARTSSRSNLRLKLMCKCYVLFCTSFCYYLLFNVAWVRTFTKICWTAEYEYMKLRQSKEEDHFSRSRNRHHEFIHPLSRSSFWFHIIRVNPVFCDIYLFI